MLEALGLAAAAGFLPEAVLARGGTVMDPHPAWIAVLLLAARDGLEGLLAGLVAAAVAVGAGALLSGAGLGTEWSRLGSAANVGAFGAALAVSWVGGWHLRRRAELRERMLAHSARAAQAESAAETLGRDVEILRARAHRTSQSLSFLRDVAARLEGRDPVSAAEGAADLALARTGASAAAVTVGMGGFQRLLAVRDARGPAGLAPLEPRDADLTLPIRNGADRVGVLALWGIRRPGLDAATMLDVEAIASWCARPLAIAAWRPESSHPARRLP